MLFFLKFCLPSLLLFQFCPHSQMSTPTEKTGNETRSILAPTGNRVPVIEQQRPKKEMTKKKKSPEKPAAPSPAKPAAAAVVRSDVSADSSSDSSSSASSSSGSIVKSTQTTCSRRMKSRNGVVRPAKNVPADGVGAMSLSPAVKRCDWITPNSEPVYTCFHDEEWGVPVDNDDKLFELLVFSQALAELSWPLILSKRAVFRKIFNDFDPALVANLDEERLVSIRLHGTPLLSEPKVRAIVHNAKQLLKIQQEFGSFSNYCWRFVNDKPIKSGHRYARQVPAKTPKSDVVSKDLMQRGFHCVGPTVVYSFMQVAGLVNDHLVACYRYNQCTRQVPTTT